MKKILAIILVIMFGVTSCKNNYIEEKEGNNSWQNANLITDKKMVKGFFNSEKDIDFYKISIQENLTMSINLTAVKGINHSIKIWTGSGDLKLVKLIDDNRKSSPESMKNIFLSQGDYYISIQHGERDLKKKNIKTPYNLKIIFKNYILEEKEPNDNFENASEVEIEQEVIGYYTPAYNRLKKSKSGDLKEEDFFFVKVNLSENEVKLLNITLSGVVNVDSVLNLYDDKLNLISSSNKNGIGEAESISGIGIKRSNKYYISLHSKGFQTNDLEPYNLKLFFTEYNPSFEMEPNNVYLKANRILKNEVSGRVDYIGDTDFFKYNNTVRDKFFKISLLSPGSIDLQFAIYNSAGKRLLIVDNREKGENEIYPNFNYNGNFYIRVNAKNSNFKKDEEYFLTVTPLENFENIEKEPNDSKELAGVINDEEIIGFISKKGDRDFYLLKYDERVKLDFNITGIKNGSIKVSITDPLGYTIKSVDVKGNVDKSISEMVDKKGYIIVESNNENYENPYVIKIKVEK